MVESTGTTGPEPITNEQLISQLHEFCRRQDRDLPLSGMSADYKTGYSMALEHVRQKLRSLQA